MVGTIKNQVFGERGLPNNLEVYNKKVLGLKNNQLVSVLAFVFVPIIAFLLSSYMPVYGDQNIVNIIFKIIGILVLSYLSYIMYKATPDERKKLIVAIFLTLFMMVFWGFHELSGSVITLFAARNVNLTFIDAAQSNALNAMYIIILSLPIAWLWKFLSKRKINPRTPYKFAIGLAFAAICFYILAISANSADADGRVPFSYLLIMYFILSVGELFMSPVGLSKITDLSPKRIVSFMMGVWFLSSAYAFQIVGFIGKKLSIESSDKDIGGFDSLEVYTDGFHMIALYAGGAAIITLILAPILKRLMGDVH